MMPGRRTESARPLPSQPVAQPRARQILRTQLVNAWWLIAVSIAAGVAGQAAIKLGVGGAPSGAGGLWGLVATIAQSPLILAGLALYGVGALAWIAVLAKLDLSYAYPFLALNFVLITLVARFGLGEVVPFARWMGVAVICAGIILIARSGL